LVEFPRLRLKDGFRFHYPGIKFVGYNAPRIRVPVLILPEADYNTFLVADRFATTDTSAFSDIQRGLINRVLLFDCAWRKLDFTSFKKDYAKQRLFFRDTAILLRLMTTSRGVEGSTVRLLSPSILEVIAARYFVEMRKVEADRFGLYDPFDMAQFVCLKFASFNFEHHYWDLNYDIPKDQPSPKIEILHPIDRERILTGSITQPTSRVILDAFKTASTTESLDDFTLDAHKIVAMRYSQCVYVKVQAVSNPHVQSRIEIRVYKAVSDMSLEMAQLFPNDYIHPWPFLFNSLVAGKPELVLPIYFARADELLSEEDGEYMLTTKTSQEGWGYP
jgi:hypothetical protein